MIRRMRRKDLQLSEGEALRLLAACRFGMLCTVCADGTPYGIPMHHALDGRSLYMHCSSEGGLKLENIALCPRACFTVVGEAGGPEEGASPRLRSAVAFGRIRILATKEENRLGLEALLRGRPRRRPADAGAMRKVHVLRFDIERLTGSGR